MPYLLCVCFLSVVGCFSLISADSRSGGGYNFLVIVTDDQDIMLKGMTPMAKTLEHIANKGMTFVNAFTTSPICCPSRSSILTGKYAHNHKATNNSQSGGCNGRVWQEKMEPAALPVLLSESGYETFFAGKYLNEYFSSTVPPGWSQWFGLHGNSRYSNFTVTENGIATKYYTEYFTDYLNTKTTNFLKNITAEQRFFAMVAPPAPHAPFTPADRHKDLFPEVKAIKTPNFNVSSSTLGSTYQQLIRVPAQNQILL
uniref:Sulfatase N-terminal domain-containing protein n=1 Tax=Anopheles epiroticus TaxID=199890 RepID=A0A182PNF8_9DIPT